MKKSPKDYEVTTLLMMINIVSFLGFCLENTWLLFIKGYMDNRNMTLPFLLGYGLGVVAFYLLLGTPEHFTLPVLNKIFKTAVSKYIVYYVVAFFAVSVGELVLGFSVEKICGFHYWSYLAIPLHFTRYTSVPTSLGFAFAVTVFMGKVFTPVMDYLQKISSPAMKCITIILFAILCIDFVVSFNKMYTAQAMNRHWKLRVAMRKTIK